MKKSSFLTLVMSITFSLFIATLTGCNNYVDGHSSQMNQHEYMHIQELISIDQLTNEFSNINNLMLIDDTLYFSSTDVKYEGSMFYVTRLFSLDIANRTLVPLSNYKAAAEVPYGADGGTSFITSILSDNNGNLWVVERGSFFYFDLPAHISMDDMGNDELWEHFVELDNFTAVRKLDGTGEEILSVDLSEAINHRGFMSIIAFSADYEDNIYIGFGNTIMVFDYNGHILFDVEIDGWVGSLVRFNDGTVAHFGWDDMVGSMRLLTIDTQQGGWGSNITIPAESQGVFCGNGDFLFFVHNGTNLYGINTQADEPELIIDMLGNGIMPANVSSIAILPDERIFVTLQSWEQMSEFATTDLMIFTPTPADVLAERAVITIATWHPNIGLRRAIANFNAGSSTHIIEMSDYGHYGFDAEDRLNLDMLAGNVPDIFDMSNFNLTGWSDSGAFLDLYQFIDADSEISRSMFVDGALHVAETDGRLYEVPYFFSVNTLIGNTEFVGDVEAWTIENFKAVIAENPQIDYPIGQSNNTREAFLHIALSIGFHDFIDWNIGTTHFDSSEFAELLTFAYEYFPENTLSLDEFIALLNQHYADIPSGRQIMTIADIFDFHHYSVYREIFGNKFSILGFPSSNGGKSVISHTGSFAISSTSNAPNAAWEFIRTFLTIEGQQRNVDFGLPANRAWFEQRLTQAVGEGSYPIDITIGDFSFELPPLEAGRAVEIIELVDSIESIGFTALRGSGSGRYDELWNIILEGALSYWSGHISAQDAARVIQNRTSILVSERQR